MTEQKTILIIGRHQFIMDKISALLHDNGFLTVEALTDENAVDLFQQHSVDAVLIGGGVEMESRSYFHRVFMEINPAIKLIDAHPQNVLESVKNAFEA